MQKIYKSIKGNEHYVRIVPVLVAHRLEWFSRGQKIDETGKIYVVALQRQTRCAERRPNGRVWFEDDIHYPPFCKDEDDFLEEYELVDGEEKSDSSF